jgi:hypothetical protein
MAIYRGPNVVRNGLVLALDAADKNSYVGSGTSWRDLSGNSNNGTLTNGPTFNGGNGGSIVFDGVDDSIDLGNVLQLGTQSRTYCCWYKMNSTTQDGFASLISKTNTGAQAFRQALAFQTNGNFTIVFRDQSNISYDMNIINPKIDLNWHYLVWIIDRTSSYFLYQDSILLNSKDISAINGQNFQLNNKFRIGSYNTQSDTITLVFNGNISNVIVYNRALTATEVLQNYNAQKTRFGL